MLANKLFHSYPDIVAPSINPLHQAFSLFSSCADRLINVTGHCEFPLWVIAMNLLVVLRALGSGIYYVLGSTVVPRLSYIIGPIGR